MVKAKKGDWVEVSEILLNPGERSPKLPDDTKALPFIQYIKGFLVNGEAQIGDKVEIKTLIGRTLQGDLCEINPRHTHDFGSTVKELIEVGVELRNEIQNL